MVTNSIRIDDISVLFLLVAAKTFSKQQLLILK